MRRATAVTAAVLMALGAIAACGHDDPAPVPTTTAPTPRPPTPQPTPPTPRPTTPPPQTPPIPAPSVTATASVTAGRTGGPVGG